MTRVALLGPRDGKPTWLGLVEAPWPESGPRYPTVEFPVGPLGPGPGWYAPDEPIGVTIDRVSIRFAAHDFGVHGRAYQMWTAILDGPEKVLRLIDAAYTGGEPLEVAAHRLKEQLERVISRG